MGYRAAPVFCRECGTPTTSDLPACTACGTPRDDDDAAEPNSALGEAKGFGSAIGLYCALLLGTLLPMQWIEPENLLRALDGIIVFDTLVVLAWAFAHRRDLAPLLRKLGRPADWGLVLLAVPVTLAVAFANLWISTELFGVADNDLFALYLASGYSLPLVLLIGAIQPAVVEELAFRGIILERMSALTEPRTAVIVTAALFTILHLAFFGAVFLLVLGLLAGWLRWRSGSIYPAIALHLLHNAVVILIAA